MLKNIPKLLAVSLWCWLWVMGAGTSHAEQLARTQVPIYGPNENIVVQFSGLPGNAQDWVTITPPSAPETQYGEYYFTAGKKDGTLSFNGLPAGTYEVRVFFNWPAGGYVIHDRYPFLVQPTAGGGIAWTQKPVYAPQEQIVVEYSRLPGNPQDWITLVAASQPDNQYGEYFFTQGRPAGQLNFNGLPPGTYEVRLYYNWQADGFKTQFRYPFIVR